MSKPKYDGKYVEILKWSKFNPRGDSKFPSWFRCENTLFFSPAFIDLDAQEICVALFVMCQVSAKNGEPTQIKTSHIARHARADHAKVESALDKLEQEGFLRLVDPKAVSAGPAPSVRDPVTFDWMGWPGGVTSGTTAPLGVTMKL